VNNADEPEQPITQGNGANASLEVHVWGDKAGTRIADQTYNNHLTYAMTLLCTSNCAITLRDKNNDVDLSGGVATLRWRTRLSGFRNLHPIVKLADGRWLIARKTAKPLDGLGRVNQLVGACAGGPWTSNACNRAGTITDGCRTSTGRGDWFHRPDEGAGHGVQGGSRIDWIEGYGKPVPRVRNQSSGR
jgi:hypothetical protein